MLNEAFSLAERSQRASILWLAIEAYVAGIYMGSLLAQEVHGLV